jgi:hypothetical protein
MSPKIWLEVTKEGDISGEAGRNGTLILRLIFGKLF